MPDSKDIQHQRDLLAQYRRNVAHLLRQVAGYGGITSTPTHIINELNSNRQQISAIKTILRSWGSSENDHPDDAATVYESQPLITAQTSLPPLQPSVTRPYHKSLTWWVSLATIAALFVAVVAWIWPNPFNFGDAVSNAATKSAVTEPTTISDSDRQSWIATPTQSTGMALLPPATQASAILRYTLSEHTAELWGVAFSPDDDSVFTAGSDGRVLHWSSHSGLLLDEFGSVEANQTVIGDVAVNADGTLLAIPAAINGNDKYGEGDVRLYQVADGERLQTFTGHSAFVWGVDFSSDSTMLASGSADGTIRIWNVANGSEEQLLRGHTKLVVRVAFSPDNSRLASVSYDGSLRIWDLSNGTQRYKVAVDNTFAVAWTPDGRYIVSGSGDQSIHIINANDGTFERSIKTPNNPITLAISPDGQIIASACDLTTLCLWSFQTGAKLTEFGDMLPNAIAWSKNGLFLVEGGNNKHARIWQIEYR